jgi:hypothetical protein
MKKIPLFVLFILLNLWNINAHSIVGGIRIFYNRTFLTFQKEDTILTIDLSHILTRSAIYQYINSSYDNGYYYILFFAKSWWLDTPSARGEWGAGQIKTVFIVKIREDFGHYEIDNQFLSNFEPQEYMMSEGGFKRNRTIFYWNIMGSNYIGNDRSELWRIISVDASRLEIGIKIYEYQNDDLMYDYWRRIIGVDDREEFIFSERIQL